MLSALMNFKHKGELVFTKNLPFKYSDAISFK